MTDRLTREQAIIISGYTGVAACNFSLLHEDVEKRMGRPVWTHQFATEAFAERVRDLYRDDFLALCHTENDR